MSLLTMTKVMPTAMTRVARGVAQQRLEGVGRAEEVRVEVGADQIEERHHDEEADLPAAHELHGGTAGQ